MYFRGAQAAHIVPSTPFPTLSVPLCVPLCSTPTPCPYHDTGTGYLRLPLRLCFCSAFGCGSAVALLASLLPRPLFLCTSAQIHAHKLLPWQRQQQHSTGTNFLFLPHPGWKKKAKQGCMQHGMDMDMDGFSFRLPTLSLLVSLSISLSPSLHAYSSLLWSFY